MVDITRLLKFPRRFESSRNLCRTTARELMLVVYLSNGIKALFSVGLYRGPYYAAMIAFIDMSVVYNKRSGSLKQWHVFHLKDLCKQWVC